MITEILRSLIDESPHHKRSRWGDMEAFAAGIRANGVETPGKARKSPRTPGRFELIYGHRRFRGAGMAELDTMPLVIVEMTTPDVIAAQVRENRDREGCSPVDEGASYTLLQDEHGLSIAEIAERVNAPASTVAARLRLVKMIAPLLDLIDRERMPIVAGQLLALQEQDVQEQIFDDLSRLHPTGWITKADVERVLERHVRRLDRAPFATTLETLTPAGACTSCPRNTSVQRDMFDEGPGVCTLPPCYAAKVDAGWAIMVANAEKRGCKVLTSDEAALAIDGTKVRPGAGVVDLDTPIAVEDPMTWRELEREIASGRSDGQGYDQSKVSFARVADSYFELVSAPYVAAYIDKRYPDAARKLRGEMDPAVAAERELKAKKKAKAAIELEARKRAMATLVPKLTDDLEDHVDEKVTRLCILMAVDLVGAAVAGEVARRRELALAGEHEREIAPREALARAVSEMTPRELRALLAELLSVRTLTDENNTGKIADELLGLAGVSRKKLEKELVNEGRNVKVKKPRRSLPVVVDAPSAEPVS